MIKVLLGIAIVAFTGFCGFVFAKKYRQRKKFFAQLWEFNERFLSEIAYYRRPIKEFIAIYSYQGEFQEVLKDFTHSLSEDVQTMRFLENSKYSFLKEEEKQTLNDYFLMLGKGDSSSQKGYFASVKDTLVRSQNETEIEAKKYGDLYIKIGFLCGLLILILIV